MEKIDRMALEQKINALDLDNESKSQLLELLRERKKYGIVWEEHPEDVEERLRSELPVLVEDKDKAIISEDKDAPNHILIEGDNLEALTALSYTHEGKIDVIYIDPPYNTGHKDFTYNDKYVDKDDEYLHSKWLSFMNKRLRIAKRLLSDKGAIFISIGDDEDANLKILCNEIFEEKNKISDIIWQSRKSVSNDTFVSMNHNYTLVYAKHIEMWSKEDFKMPSSTEHFENRDNDPRGPWVADPFDAPNIRPNLTYPITNPNTGEIYFPPKGRCWRTTKDMYLSYLHDNRIVFGKKGTSKPQLKRFQYEAEEKGNTPISIWNDIATTTEGTRLLMSIFDGEKIFSNPKPIELIQRILVLMNKSDAKVLDFFAGSGTTLHAVMALNSEDGGNRQCILTQAPETTWEIVDGKEQAKKWCEVAYKLGYRFISDITYERNKRVINGYTTPKGEVVEGLHNNTLRYYRTSFVARESSSTAKRELMYAAADMLCIKNDIYTEQKQFGSLRFRKDVVRYFADGDKQMLVIYNPDAIETIVEEIKKMNIKTPIITYVFSLNDYAMDTDFEDVADKVSLCALPSAILNAYYKVLPKKIKQKEAI